MTVDQFTNSKDRISDLASGGQNVKRKPPRKYSIRERIRVVNHYNSLPNGEKGLFLRANGFHYSTMQNWREQINHHRDQGLAMLDSDSAASTENNSEILAQLQQAKAVIEKQREQLQELADLKRQLAEQSEEAENQRKLVREHKKQLKSSKKALKQGQRKLDKAKKVIELQKKAHNYLESASRHLLKADNSSSKL